jgi:hypothetical protein
MSGHLKRPASRPRPRSPPIRSQSADQSYSGDRHAKGGSRPSATRFRRPIFCSWNRTTGLSRTGPAMALPGLDRPSRFRSGAGIGVQPEAAFQPGSTTGMAPVASATGNGRISIFFACGADWSNLRWWAYPRHVPPKLVDGKQVRRFLFGRLKWQSSATLMSRHSQR